jgi:outer membrane protein assembly factor BamB
MLATAETVTVSAVSYYFELTFGGYGSGSVSYSYSGGSGTVSSSQGELYLTVSPGMQISLTANPNAGSGFAGWADGGGAIVVSNPTSLSTNVTMYNGNGALEAYFILTDTLSIISFDGGSVSYSYNGIPSGIVSGTVSSGQTTTLTTIEGGTQISLTANPNSGYVFSNWFTSGPVTLSNSLSESTSLTIDGNGGSVSAVFTLPNSGGNPTSWPIFHHDLAHSGYSSSTAPNTNQTLWTFAPPYGFFEYESAAIVGGVLYVGSLNSYNYGAFDFYALNASTEATIWTAQPDPAPISDCPAVANGVVYVGRMDGYLCAYNAATGAEIWSYLLKSNSYIISSPSVAYGIVYIGSPDNNVYALNAATGTFVWKYNTGSTVSSSPAIANGIVYVENLDDEVYALNAQTGTLIWTYQGYGTTPIASSPAVVNGVVYVGSASGEYLYAFNASTGKTIWAFNPSGYGLIDSSPAVAYGMVYVGAYDGNFYAVNETTGTLIWKYTTGSWVESSPAVADGIVYVGSDDGNMYALNALTGNLIWSCNSAGGKTSPAIASGVVYMTNGYNELYAFGLPPSSRTYTATFNESGLPNPPVTGWWADLNGDNQSSISNVISFSEPNGTYTYTAGASGYIASPSSGSITVNGASVRQAITFTKVSTYSITFTESGLPSGTGWWADLNGNNQSSTSNPIRFSEPNGVYTYGAGASGYVASPSSGSVTVNGASVNESITFSASPPTFSFSISLGSTSGSMAQGNSIRVNVNVSPTSGSPQTITLSANGLPSGTTAIFSQPSGTPTFSSTMSITTSQSTPTGTYAITVSGNGEGQGNTATFTLTVNPPTEYATSITAGIGGSVSYSDAGSGSVPSGQTEKINANPGAQISLTANPDPSHVFESWSTTGVIILSSSSSASTSADIGSNGGSITANFASNLVVNISPPSATLTAGQSLTFTATASGGSGGYTYVWYWTQFNTANQGSTNTGSTSTYTFTPSNPGSYEVYVKVTDSAGNTNPSLFAPVAVGAQSTTISVSNVQFQSASAIISGWVNLNNPFSSPTAAATYAQGIIQSGQLTDLDMMDFGLVPFSLDVTNTGTVTATNVQIQITFDYWLNYDALILGTSICSGTSSPIQKDDIESFWVGNIPAGATVPFSGDFEIRFANIIAIGGSLFGVSAGFGVTIIGVPTTGAIATQESVGVSGTNTNRAQYTVPYSIGGLDTAEVGGTIISEAAGALGDKAIPGADWLIDELGSYVSSLGDTSQVSTNTNQVSLGQILSLPVQILQGTIDSVIDLNYPGSNITLTAYGPSGNIINAQTQAGIDQIVIPNPTQGQWDIQITGVDLPSGPETANMSIITLTGVSVNINPPSTRLTVVQPVSLMAMANGGSGTYVDYKWYWAQYGSTNQGSQDTGSSNSYQFTPSDAGTYYVYVVVTDSNGTTGQSLYATVSAGVHDIAVTNIMPSENVVVEGNDLNISVTVSNLGDYNETFNMTLYGSQYGYNVTWPICTFTNVTLAPGGTVTLTYEDSFTEGLYTLSAGVYNAYVNSTYTGVTILVAPIVRALPTPV